jgi:hypothetical protein
MASRVESATLFDIGIRRFRENRVPFSDSDVTMKHLRFLCAAATLIAASLTLSGCGLFGCSGFATNGGGFGGCSVGTRF